MGEGYPQNLKQNWAITYNDNSTVFSRPALTPVDSLGLGTPSSSYAYRVSSRTLS